MDKSIGQTARELIVANPGKKNAELLEMVRQAHPGGKTTIACIAWYKNDLKKNAHKHANLLASKEEPVRTSEVIQAEIDELMIELEMVKDEEKTAALATIEADMAALKALAAKLGLELPEPTIQ